MPTYTEKLMPGAPAPRLNSAPFGRPRAGDMVAMLDFMESKGAAFPQRGGWRAQGAGLPRNEMLA